MNSFVASSIASLACLGIFLGHVYFNGLRWYAKHKQRFWQDVCPFAVRNRLPNSPYVLVKKDDGESNAPINGISLVGPPTALHPIRILEVLLFILMPIYINIPSWILIKTVFHSVGSLYLVRTLNITLALGWIYRLSERWALDGCRHILLCSKRMDLAKKNGNNVLSSFWMIMAARLSPTAALHFWTGITVLAGYCHVRSLDIVTLSTHTTSF